MTAKMKIMMHNTKVRLPKAPTVLPIMEMSKLSVGQDLANLKTLLAPDVPAEGQYFDVTITFAVSPSNFVVQPYSEGPKLEVLMSDLNTFYNKDENLHELLKSTI